MSVTPQEPGHIVDLVKVNGIWLAEKLMSFGIYIQLKNISFGLK